MAYRGNEPVFDITVADDHSFVAHGFVVHNCQAFSMAGKGGGKRDLALIWRALDDVARGVDSRVELTARAADPRSLVVVEPLRWALTAAPRWMVWEQVPPVRPVWDACALILRDAGYSTWTGELNAADYGVPQTRRRAFLLARLDGPVLPPAPTHARDPQGADLFGDALHAWVSMAEALNMDGIDRPARTVAGNRAPRWAYGPGASYATGWTLATGTTSETSAGMVPYERETDRPAPVVTGRADRWTVRSSFGTPSRENRGGTHEFDPAERPAHTVTGKAGHWRLRNNTQGNAAQRGLDEPAPTLFFGARLNDVSWVRERPATTVLGDPRLGRPGHKGREFGGESHFAVDSVRISIEQAAILQSFPSDYPFQGTKTARFQQVGNAVPPLLAAHCIAAAAGVATGLRVAA
jgi:DNA (cytosine-5)-methyltransferase 1